MDIPAPATRPIADVISDPNTKWADIRAAIKTGRGSFAVGAKNNIVFTNNGGGGAFKAPLRSQKKKKRISSATTTTSSDEDEEDKELLNVKQLLTLPCHPEAANNVGSSSIIKREVMFKRKEDYDDEANVLEDAIKTQSGNSVSLLIDNTSASLLRDNTSLPSPARRLYGEDSIELVPSDSTGNVSPKGKRVLPERYLPRNSSAKGASFRDSLKNVKTDSEDERRLPARHFTRSSSKNGGSFRGNSKNVLNADSEEDERRLPARRLPRSSSKKGGSFRGSLTNVLEDVEANMDDILRLGGINDPPARHLPKSGSFRSISLKSIHIYNSNSSISTDASCNDHGESINVMDFGVSQRGEFSESSSNASPSIASNNMSELVDSDGFLAWENGSSSSARSIDNYRPAHSDSSSSATSINIYRSSDSSSSARSTPVSNSNDSSLANLVDSQGFLDWKSSSQGDERSRGLTGSIDDALIEDVNYKRVSSTRDDGDEPEKLCESWHIEDYEGPKYNEVEFTKAKRSGSGNLLSKRLRRVSRNATEVISAKMNLWNISPDDETKDAIKTNDVNHILLRGRSSDGATAKRDEAKDDKPLRNSTGSMRNPTVSDSSLFRPDDNYDSRPAIWVKDEDSIDIGELRRDLCEAGNKDEGAMSTLKLGFL